MEPRPWPEDGATEIEKALLRAGRAEVPRKGADLRMLAMIHGSAPPAVKPVALTRWVKVGLVAIVAGGAAVVGTQLSRLHAVPASGLSARAVGGESVPLLAAPAEGGAPGKTAVAPEVSERVQTAREKEPRSVANEGSRVASRRARPAGSARDHSLGEETKALDHAREALDARRPSEVLRLIDEYRHRFPNGRLRPEAMILRLAALVQAGGHEAADSLARQLLSDEAYASYAPRIQSLLREARQ
jgi:hypothetical protein